MNDIDGIKIRQIIAREYSKPDGTRGAEIMGLGDDNLLYQWHRGTGKWILNIISN